MRRRNFLAGSGAAVAGANLIPFLRSSAAWAQGAADTLVIATSTTITVWISIASAPTGRATR